MGRLWTLRGQDGTRHRSCQEGEDLRTVAGAGGRALNSISSRVAAFLIMVGLFRCPFFRLRIVDHPHACVECTGPGDARNFYVYIITFSISAQCLRPTDMLSIG